MFKDYNTYQLALTFDVEMKLPLNNIAYPVYHLVEQKAM